MKKVNLQYAKDHLDSLVDEAIAGEDVVIAEGAGRQVRLMPVPAVRERVFGLDQGRISIPDDFDAPMPEIERLFYGGSDDPD